MFDPDTEFITDAVCELVSGKAFTENTPEKIKQRKEEEKKKPLAKKILDAIIQI